MKKFLLLMVGLLTILLCGCSEALNCLSGNCVSNDSTDVTTSAKVYLDKDNLAINPDSSDTFTFTVKGGESKESFEIILNDPQLSFASNHKNLHARQGVVDKDVSLSTYGCILNNYDNQSCTVTVSMAKTGAPGRYSLKPEVFELKPIKTPVDMQNIVIQASRQIASDSKTITDYSTTNTTSRVEILEAESKIVVYDIPYDDQNKLSNLNVSFSTTGENVYVVYDDGREIEQKSSGETLNFLTTVEKYKGHLKYKVVAQDSSFRFYDVDVNVARASDKDLTSYTILGEGTYKAESSNVFNLTTGYSDLTHLEVSFTTNGEKVEYQYKNQWFDTKPSPKTEFLDFTESIPYRVTAQDGSVKYYKVNVKNNKPTDGDWIYLGESNISVGNAQYVSMAIDHDNQPTIAYVDKTSDSKLVVKHFDKASEKWVSLAAPGINGTSNVSIAIDKNGVVYVAYKLETTRGNLIKYSNGVWTNLGDFGSVGGRSARADLTVAIDPITNLPYVSFAVGGLGDSVAVRYFDGASWNTIFTNDTGTHYPLIAFSTDGELYLSYINTSLNNKLDVLKYDRESHTFSDPVLVSGTEEVDFTNFIVGNDGVPYITFYNKSVQDTNVFSGKNFNSWTSVGNQYNISATGATYQNIASDTNSTLYVVYNDAGMGTTVKYNNGNQWVALGTTHFSGGDATFVDFAISKTNPYVAYINNNNRVSVMYYTKGLAPKN